MAQKDIAWEFLRRNDEYVAAFLAAQKHCEETRSRLAGLWGLRDFADPSHSAQETVVFWRHDCCSSVIILSAGNLGDLGVGLSSLDLTNMLCHRRAADGADILLSHQDTVRQLFIPRAPGQDEQLCAIIPLDQMADKRLGATCDYWRGATGRKALAKKPQRKKTSVFPAFCVHWMAIYLAQPIEKLRRVFMMLRGWKRSLGVCHRQEIRSFVWCAPDLS